MKNHRNRNLAGRGVRQRPWWVRVHTDEGPRRTRRRRSTAPRPLPAHVHRVLAGRLLGKDPLRIEALNRAMVDLPMAQSSTGAEYRAASAVGHRAVGPVRQGVRASRSTRCLAACAATGVRIYNTCAGYQYVRSQQHSAGRYLEFSATRALTRTCRRSWSGPPKLAESLLAQGISGMKIWPFDPIAQANGGRYISAAELKKALWARSSRSARRSATRWTSWSSSTACGTCRRPSRSPARWAPYEPYWLEDPIRMNSPPGAGGIRARHAVPRLPPAKRWAPPFPYREMLSRGRHGHRHGRHLLDRRP